MQRRTISSGLVPPVVAGLVLAATMTVPEPASAASRVVVSFQGGTLVVTGTGQADEITISKAGARVVVTSVGPIRVTGQLPRVADVKRLRVVTGAGDDIVKVKVPLPSSRVEGGPGNDKLVGSPGSDRLRGGAGNDNVNGGGGDDQLGGGDGTDVVVGGAGDDVVVPGLGPDLISGGSGDDQIAGGPGGDTLDGGAGDDTATGGDGSDTYLLDVDNELGADSIVEVPGGGNDTLDFSGTTSDGITVDLRSTDPQDIEGLELTLPDSSSVEWVTGTNQDDEVAGNTSVNFFQGRDGRDVFRHHGPADGVDIVVVDVLDLDYVKFDTGGQFRADEMSLDATATHLRDAAGGTWGVDFTLPVLVPGGFYPFGLVDTPTEGTLLTFNANSNGVIAQDGTAVFTYQQNGTSLGGAGGRDRLVDYSPNGNTLIGRDGQDTLLGGAGNDTLIGDEGFAAGVSDLYTGGAGADTFTVGRDAFANTTQAFGDDGITDFEAGVDHVDLYTGLSVKSGLGTTLVTIWDGVNDFGTIGAGNGHLWIPADFV